MLAPRTISIMPAAIRSKNIISTGFSRSLRNMKARSTHARGDKLLTTPIIVRGICLVQNRLIRLTIVP